MTNIQFEPGNLKKPKFIFAKITLREAQIIELMRQQAWGEITVYKSDATPIRVESKKSLKLDDELPQSIEYYTK